MMSYALSHAAKQLPRKVAHNRNALFLIFLVMGLILGLTGGYFLGNPDYLKIQQSVGNTKTAYVEFLQNALSKIGDVSQNKSVKVAGAGFDTLATVLKFASKLPSITGQHDSLCNPTAAMEFNRTSTLTSNRTIYSNYVGSCAYYILLEQDFNQTPNSDTLRSLTSDFTDLAFSLMRLDNTISNDP